MEDNLEKSVWLVLPAVLLAVIFGLSIGGFVGAELSSLLYQGDGNFTEKMRAPTPDMKMLLMLVQGLSSLIGFLVLPYFTWKALSKKNFIHLQSSPLQIVSLLFVVAIVISFAIIDSAIIEWNQNIHFPDFFPNFLKSFETWARAQEDQLAELSKMLTKFNSIGELLIAFVVIALLAGVCEEFLFRGIVQTELFRGTKNIHLSIWVAAILFSAIHVQFFGFIPRLLLGALFGYLFYWSGNLIVPMFAHFVNNAFSILMIYLDQMKIVDTNFDTPEAAPWPAVITFALVTGALLFFFKKKFHSPNSSLA
jgi:uncharacterized protein